MHPIYQFGGYESDIGPTVNIPFATLGYVDCSRDYNGTVEFVW